MMFKNKNRLFSIVGLFLLGVSVNNIAWAGNGVGSAEPSPAAQAVALQGSMCNLKGNYEEAVANYSKAIQIDPKCAQLYKYRADSNRNAKKWDLALADYDKAISLAPSLLDAYSGRGEIKYRLKNYQSAIPDFEKAIDFKSDELDGVTSLYLLECYMQLKQYAKVVEATSTAINKKPWASFYVSRATAYLGLGENRKAISDCDLARKLDSELRGIGPIRAEAMKRLNKQ